MIFKTITSDIDKTRQSLLLFNKDWNTWKTNWNAATGVRGKIGSLFASTSISQSDVQAIQAYNAQIDSCVTSQTAFNRTMLNASPAAQNLVASCNGAKVSMQQLETATRQVTLATKVSHVALKAFSIAFNMITYTAIIKDYYNNLINKENDKISALTSQAKTLQDRLDSAIANGIKKGSEDWQSMKDEIDSVIDEINETKKSIIELQVALYLESHPLISNCHGGIEAEYTVTSEKQALMSSNYLTYTIAKASGLEAKLTWNASGCECEEWTEEEYVTLVLQISEYVKPLVSLQQSYEVAINNCTSQEELDAIEIVYDVYGVAENE